MTREEAIADIRDNIKPVVGGKSLDMAIKALEQEPCDDAISRQAVLDLAKFDGRKNLGSIIHAFDVEQLPPVTPAEKVGQWEQFGNFWEDKYKCSECGKEQPKILCGERIIGHWSDYCPNCGAKMQEVKE